MGRASSRQCPRGKRRQIAEELPSCAAGYMTVSPTSIQICHLRVVCQSYGDYLTLGNVNSLNNTNLQVTQHLLCLLISVCTDSMAKSLWDWSDTDCVELDWLWDWVSRLLLDESVSELVTTGLVRESLIGWVTKWFVVYSASVMSVESRNCLFKLLFIVGTVYV